MFLENKYSKWYFNIIETAKSRENADGYLEIHHIVPRSMGGSNNSSNLVKLTAREHFLCHLLLVKAVDLSFKKKMNFAYWRMCNVTKQRHKPNARQYAWGKFLFVEAHTGHRPYLTSHTEETKKKISETSSKNISKLSNEQLKQRCLNSFHRPDTYTEERRRNISKATAGKKKTKTPALLQAESDRKNRTPEQKLKCGAHNLGKTWKIIDGKRTWVPKEIENYKTS